MTFGFRKRHIAAAALVVGTLLLSACAGSSPSATESTSSDASVTADTSQIVIDTTFDITTIDPGREYEPTGQIVVKALYDTLLTFADDDTTTVIPDLASYEANDDFTVFTFKLVAGRVFSDGNPVTADDVVFSLQRLAGMKGNPSFLLADIDIKKVDDSTVQLTTKQSAPALPAILTTPSTAIVNAKVVKENGGTTDENDAAEKFLNANSAGSGPYTLESIDIATEAVFVKNAAYNGSQKPTYDKVIMRNVEPATQKMNVERGDSQIALGLSGDQVTTLAEGVKLETVPSATVVFLLLNQDPKINALTANADFVKGVKAAINYDGLLEIAGAGATQAYGLVPTVFLGALSAADGLKYDAAAAKTLIDSAVAAVAKETGKSEADLRKITFAFPNDIDPTGLNLTTLAERIQSQLAEVGIDAVLAPAPFATEVDAYRQGKEQLGLWYWNPDYLDPANQLAFGPGESVGLRATWTAKANKGIADQTNELYVTGDPAKREGLFQTWGKAMNAESPFVPLLQPASNVAYQPSVTNVYYNPTWLINVAGLGAV